MYPHLRLRIAEFGFYIFSPVVAVVISSMFIEMLKRNKATKLLKDYFLKKCICLYTKAFICFFKPSFCISAYMECLVVINFFCFAFSCGR